MKVKCEVTIDTESGDYEVQYWNVSEPGESIVYSDVSPLLKRIFNDNEQEVNSGIDSDEQVFKEIH